MEIDEVVMYNAVGTEEGEGEEEVAFVGKTMSKFKSSKPSL